MKRFTGILLSSLLYCFLLYGCDQGSTNNYQACENMRQDIKRLKRTEAQAEQAASTSNPGSVAQMGFFETARQCREQIYQFEMWMIQNCN